MTAEAPNLTAQRVAMRRAAHQLWDHPPVFEDPLALPIIGKEAAASLHSKPDGHGLATAQHVRAFMAARSRFAEDALATAVARGASQYVVLGAGLDTYAYRNAQPGLRVFEVDYPITQAWKRKQLDAAGIVIPASVTYVGTDFGEEPLASVLRRAGFQEGQVSFFSWLGVTPYLTPGAAVATLGFIGSLPAGSGVVFDYAAERSSLDPLEHLAMDALSSRVARAGEPVRLFLDPCALNRMLRLAGFHEIEDLGPDEVDARYFAGRSDGLRVAAGLAHLVNARI